ncbi:TetR/AcrR family transcriptional regulator [Mycoplasmatota bacterium]|nr:TetR/AcrR family transcriptional regulator [Mycoplasmatota bacterium]
MPKAFTNHEKEIIRKKLIEVAEDSLRHYGVKKTTVDELVKGANISKGTFYLFFDSKEILFFELFRLRHDSIQNNFLEKISNLKDNLNADVITNVLFDLYKQLEDSFLFSFITSGDFELVMRKVPESMLEDHNSRDDLSMEKLFSMMPNLDSKQVKVHSAALRLVLVSILHKKEIGEESFDDALKLSIRGIIIQMMKEENND